MRRTGTRLLKTVNGRPYATANDHEAADAAATAPLPTPPDSARTSRLKRNGDASKATAAVIEGEEPKAVKKQQEEEEEEEEEDYNRDPLSSGEEEVATEMANEKQKDTKFVTKKPNVSGHGSAHEGSTGFRAIKRTAGTRTKTSPLKKAAFKAPSVLSSSITSPPQRVLTDAELEESEDEDWAALHSSQPNKKRRKTHQNMHAAPSVYGKIENERRKARQLAMKKREQEKGQKASDANTSIAETPAPAFKRRGLPNFHSAGTTAGAIEGPDGSSSPLSSLSASPEPDSMSVVCETCDERVNKLLKEEYDDYYVKGKSWNIQWQERFCEWHRAQAAKEVWEKKGYPNLDWIGLERRMRQHDDFLLSVLRDKTKSHYRDEYAAKVKAKSMSNGFKDATARPGAIVGYYGPKGEKAMSEHILSGLSDEIRERAKTDRLVSPSGYQGGISGFVQGVLVPHLAELLIKDDMRMKGDEWTVRVRELIAESADMGELLHPEVVDRNRGVEGQDDWVVQ